MPKLIYVFCLMLVAAASQALTIQPFHDNTDMAITLSKSNYNRLVVRGDKITQAHFPENYMAIKNEEDGSLYVTLNNQKPFTLFLTTKAGHHFSTTIDVEDSLGKTIEFVPIVPSIKKPKTIKPQSNINIAWLMQNMLNSSKSAEFHEKHHYGRVIRLQKGLMLTPKTTYSGLGLTGEVLEIYNASKAPITIDDNWFKAVDVKKVFITKQNLAPKQTTKIYRISEHSHG
ncbi:MAG: type-F conjugative transfer system secretin TraK [Legionellaceae bacterium]|nr:type-F conjugative transfer system secretin TraK [Legionellaceae bacterium]